MTYKKTIITIMVVLLVGAGCTDQIPANKESMQTSSQKERGQTSTQKEDEQDSSQDDNEDKKQKQTVSQLKKSYQYSSQPLVNSNESKEFYFLSKHKSVDNKPTSKISFNPVYGISKGAFCTSSKCKPGGKKIVPVVEYNQTGRVESLTSTFKRVGIFDYNSKIVEWKSNDKLLVNNSTGEAGVSNESLSTLNISKSKAETIYSCSKSSKTNTFQCTHGDYVLVRMCKSINQCEKSIKAYRIKQSNINPRQNYLDQVINKGGLLDQKPIKTPRVDLISKFNLNNLASSLKIDSKSNAVIFDFQRESFK